MLSNNRVLFKKCVHLCFFSHSLFLHMSYIYIDAPQHKIILEEFLKSKWEWLLSVNHLAFQFFILFLKYFSGVFSLTFSDYEPQPTGDGFIISLIFSIYLFAHLSTHSSIHLSIKWCSYTYHAWGVILQDKPQWCRPQEVRVWVPALPLSHFPQRGEMTYSMTRWHGALSPSATL